MVGSDRCCEQRCSRNSVSQLSESCEVPGANMASALMPVASSPGRRAHLGESEARSWTISKVLQEDSYISALGRSEAGGANGGEGAGTGLWTEVRPGHQQLIPAGCFPLLRGAEGRSCKCCQEPMPESLQEKPRGVWGPLWPLLGVITS